MKGIDMEKITRMDDPEWVSLVDNAARGSIDAATKLAEAYTTDIFGKADFPKALKWARYAAKRGSERAEELVKEIEAKV